jgi:acetyltransferase-like isoleucine patch superfamily enzyme
VWARAWSQLGSGASWRERLAREPELRRRFDLDGAYPYYEMLRAQHERGVDSWGIDWYLDVFANDGLVLYPKKSLVANRGHDGSGAHGERSSPFGADAHEFLPERLPAPRLDEGQVGQVNEFIRRASHPGLTARVGQLLRDRASPERALELVWPLLRAARVPQLLEWALARNAHERGLRQVEGGNGARFGPASRVVNPGGRERIVVGPKTLVDGELLVHDYGGRIHIGASSYIGMGSRLWSGEDLRVGDHVFIAHNVTITDTNSHQMDAAERADHYQRTVVDGGFFEKSTIKTAPVVIGDHAWINFNVAILKGVTIGEGAIIGAGSVVTKDVPPYVLCAGNPARVIRPLEGRPEGPK